MGFAYQLKLIIYYLTMIEKTDFDLEDYIDGIIKERSFTIEDGRARGAVQVKLPIQVEEKSVGGDDEDSLG
ncbi:MAG: hypothetical protein UU12_C0002G0029 [Candidatus Woesebacteria bacterium GW2011_GWA2_40_7b]|uniref:Uncharacterized protein n=1 Tax=Candidatus Woesebacteria bacterium GW2011_GWA2_40_7b TaxID=1618563 RepID=A0A0G0T998_9BACT|nr:MAG: hypothetical protein UU12_C0002G0029 [Candidatus Woesebacteria bacterium GW2011_GWA2_40_7b]